MTPRLIPFFFVFASSFALEGTAGAGQDPRPTQDLSRGEFEDLRRRIERLERSSDDDSAAPVDLSSGGEQASGHEASAHPLARPWYQNVDLWGFGAFDYFDTGGTGVHPEGGFLIKETSLFLEAHPWDGTALFFEIQANRLGQDSSKYVRTGEVHAHLREVWSNARGDRLNLKVGRVDVPFGEEYLWQDATDNPLISNSASYPYGFDEGVLAYGNWSGIGWIVAVTDGTDDRSLEDDPAKAVNLKLYGNPSESLYLSASLMRNGDSEESALEFGGSHIVPVGAGGASTAGSSPSESVDSFLYELDARCSLGSRSDVALTFGQARVDDDVSSFDRDITWFALQLHRRLSRETYAVLRYSEIGTYDSDEGYHFDGKTIADGNAAFGFDTKRLRRVAAGVGWRPNPRLLIKGEVGRDRFELIDASPFDTENDERTYLGVELVVSF